MMIRLISPSRLIILLTVALCGVLISIATWRVNQVAPEISHIVLIALIAIWSIFNILIPFSSDMLSPIKLTSGFFLIVFVLVAEFQISTGAIKVDHDLVKALALALVGIVAFSIGYFARLNTKWSVLLPKFSFPVFRSSLLIMTGIFVSISAMSLISYLLIVGGTEYIRSLGNLRITSAKGLQYILWGTIFSATALILWYAYDVSLGKRGRIKSYGITIILLTYAVLVLAASGTRTFVIYPLFALIACRHYLYRKFRLLTLFVLSCVVIGSAIFIQLIRLATISGTPNASSISQIFHIDFLLRMGASEFAILDDLIAAVRIWPSQSPFVYGSTYLSALVLPIPRLIWPGKPSLSAAYRMNIALYGQERANVIGGTTITALGEAYINFGLIGVIVSMLLIGIVSRFVYQYLKTNQSNPGVVAIYASFLYTLFLGLRGEFSLAIILFIQLTLPILIYITFLRFIQSPIKSRHTLEN